MHWHMAKSQTISMLIWQLERESPGYQFGVQNKPIGLKALEG